MKRGPERRIWLIVGRRKPLRGTPCGSDNPTKTIASSHSATNRRTVAAADASRVGCSIRSRFAALRRDSTGVCLAYLVAKC